MVAGFFMIGQSFENAALGSPSVSAVASLVGGGAGVLIGISVLAGRGEFDIGDARPNHATALGLVVVSLLCFGAGVALMGL